MEKCSTNKVPTEWLLARLSYSITKHGYYISQRTSSKLSGDEFKETTGTFDRWKLLSRCEFLQQLAPDAVRDKRINTHTNNGFQVKLPPV